MLKKILFIIFGLFIISENIIAQTFLNGDFEINTAGGVDQINLSNAAFNAMMSNTTAYGFAGNMDIITSSNWGGGGPQSGSYYVAMHGNGQDEISMKLSAPLIAGNSYSIGFYDRKDSTYSTNVIQIGLATADSTFGTLLYTTPTPPVDNTWTYRAFTFTAPNNGQYITLFLTGTPPDWVNLDNFAFFNTITTGVIAGNPLCACSTINVPFTSSGTFASGNIYTAELSDASGSFTTPTTIGTLSSTSNIDTITCTIPCNTPAGTLYRIRVVSSNPNVIGTDNGVDLTINSNVTPSVTISATDTTICNGDPIQFTATPTNGGTTPVYQWQVNGTNVGTNSPTFTSSTLNNGDQVAVMMVSNAVCPFPDTVFSDTITVTVVTSVTPSVNITASDTTICAGDIVTFTTAPVNGGATPGYQWQVNGINAGTSSPSFVSTTLNNGDVVTVIMTSSISCASPTSVTSNAITITVASSVTPSVSITASTTTICAGDIITFTSSSSNGGTSPSYQWQVNGTNAGTSSPSFVSTTLNNGDVVTVIMTSSSSCASPAADTSNAITITVTPSVIPSVSNSANTTTICSGDPVTFTATPTNGGSAPVYQWQINGINTGTNASTFTSSTLNDSDVVTVIMTSNAPCALPAADTSNAITITVTPSAAASVVISASNTTICTGNSATFTATPTNGGTTPIYQWQINGTNAGSNTSTFSSSSLNNGDAITVIMTSNATCVTGSPATSNTITMTVTACATPIAKFNVNDTLLCESGCVNFTDLSENSPTSWNWQFPGATPSSSTLPNPGNICYSAVGSYTVILIVTNSFGSDTLIKTNYINVVPPIPVTITGNTLINACESTDLTAFPAGTSYSWGPDVNLSCNSCQSVTVSPVSTQDYYVTYTDMNGCADSDTTTVVVTNLNTYFLPTALTPNGDGINDEIHVHGRGIKNFTLKIFDRIGEKVFETSDLEKGWNGRLLGVAMNDGVFVYVLDITFCNGETVKKHGDITLVK
jgi:gliding motility-associated-like protein